MPLFVSEPKKDKGFQSTHKLSDQIFQDYVSLQMVNIHIKTCILTLIMVFNRVITY